MGVWGEHEGSPFDSYGETSAFPGPHQATGLPRATAGKTRQAQSATLLTMRLSHASGDATEGKRPRSCLNRIARFVMRFVRTKATCYLRRLFDGHDSVPSSSLSRG